MSIKQNIFAAALVCAVLCGCGNNYIMQEGSAVLPIIEERSMTVEAEVLQQKNNEPFCCEITPENKFIFEKNANAVSSNNSINLKNELFPGKLCFCESSDTLFYSDCEGIYMMSEGIRVKISDMTAHGLNLYNGKLYFAASSESLLGGNVSGCYAGEIYSYDISENKIELLLAVNASNLYIYNDQIIYAETELREYENGHSLIHRYHPLNEGIIGEDVLRSSPIAFGDKLFAYCNGTAGITVRNNDWDILYSEHFPNNGYSMLSIYSDDILSVDYSNGMGRILKMDINDKIIKMFSVDNHYVNDYTVADGILYMNDVDAAVFEFSNDGGSKKYSYIVEIGGKGLVMDALYTAGDSIYGLERSGHIYKAELYNEHGLDFVSWGIL